MAPSPPALRRDLGKVESYAALIGILVGAGIYRATKDAYVLTGPSLVLGYAVLAPVILAIAVPYAAFQSTPVASGPGGDYAHVRSVFGTGVVTFLLAWLKMISYLGALVYLAIATAGYVIETLQIAGVEIDPAWWQRPIATFCMVSFWAIHCAGVRFFGRLQVFMCLVLGASILVLVVPGSLNLKMDNFAPFFRGGAGPFFSSLPILFFAYAGFEALAHTAGEVKDSETSLPGVYLRGVLATTVIFFLMSTVVVGVLNADEMAATTAPMADAASRFLPGGAALIVAVGGVFAAATSVNATLAVPARLAITVADDRSLPRSLARIHAGTGTPVMGLTLSLVLALFLMWTGQHGFALNIAVLALMGVYWLHSLAFLLLPRSNPEVAAAVRIGIPKRVQQLAAMVAIAALSILIITLVDADVQTMRDHAFGRRWATRQLTGTELLLVWSVLGAILFYSARSRSFGDDDTVR